MIRGSSLSKNLEISVEAEKHAWILTLIHRFLLEIK